VSKKRTLVTAFAVSLAVLLTQLSYSCYLFLRLWIDELAVPHYSLGVPVNGVLLTAVAAISSCISIPLLVFALIWFRQQKQNAKLYWIAIPVILLFGFWLSGFQYPNATKKQTTYLWHVRNSEPEHLLMEPDSLIRSLHTMNFFELREARDVERMFMYADRDKLIEELEVSVSDTMLDSICNSEEGKALGLDVREFNRSQPIFPQNYSLQFHKAQLSNTQNLIDIRKRNVLHYDIQRKFMLSLTVLLSLLFLLGRLIGRLTRSVHVTVIVPAVFVVMWFVLGGLALFMTKLAMAEKLSPTVAASLLPVCIGIVVLILYWVDRRVKRIQRIGDVAEMNQVS
jgi:hypothetical protein